MNETRVAQKIERARTAMLLLLAALVVVLVAVAHFNGFKLSSEITYGDLLVGVGTIALAIFTAVWRTKRSA